METPQNKKVIVIHKEIKPPSIFAAVGGMYVATCAMGFGAGTMIGAYAGGALGLAAAAGAPVAMGYGAVKLLRTLR